MLVTAFCSIFFYSHVGLNKPTYYEDKVIRDTIYYVVFYDLRMKNTVYGKPKFQHVKYDMSPEIKDVEKLIRKKLSRNYMVLPVDPPCLPKVYLDSIYRRDPENIYKLQELCGL